MRSSVVSGLRVLLSAVGLLCLVVPAGAQPTADQVLTAAGLSADDKQRVLNGEFVTGDSKSVSDRDLAIAMAFLVKTSPDALSRQIMACGLITSDA